MALPTQKNLIFAHLQPASQANLCRGRHRLPQSSRHRKSVDDQELYAILPSDQLQPRQMARTGSARCCTLNEISKLMITARHLQTRFDEGQPTLMPSLGIPRSPTCPPTGRRRMHSDSDVQDDAFRNESDFRLFVEATAGLEPEQPAKPKPDSLHYPSDTSPHHYGSSQPYDLVSPVAETPTTLHALQGIAQMPKSASPPRRRRPLETSPLDPIAFDLSLHSGVPPSSRLGAPSDPASTFDGVGESPLSSDDDEDELPDYAASQAQAQAAQRVEAARRAQELQRRWQEGAKRRGF
ncbi:hypothetical protein KC345_g9435 [Hortaea werneckii]|nr:hypothetical protein KC345_g9435 [Hortaea werneckii]